MNIPHHIHALLARLRRTRLADESGSQLVELSLVIPMLLFVFTGVVDFGRAFVLAMEVSSSAEAGACYGMTQPTDTAGMSAAAKLNASDLPNMSSTATYGTECADGSASSAGSNPAPSCSSGTVQYVEVDTTATYHPLLVYPGIQSLFVLTGKSRMRSSY